MKVFLHKLLVFLLPIFILLILEAILTPAFFTFRVWEGVIFKTKHETQGPFYPNQKIFKTSVGDLCHHTNKAILKTENWVTDVLGFRNERLIQKADIVFIGDSFTAGSSLNQDETISSQVRSLFSNIPQVYNMGRGSFSQLDFFLKKGIMERPSTIIFSIVERNIPERISIIEDLAFYNLRRIGNMDVFIDKAMKLSSIKWLEARIFNSHGNGKAAVGNPNMFFYQGNKQKHNPSDLTQTAKVICSYKRYCDSLNIRFLFLPMPDKESVYFELVPFENQPSYLLKLDSILKINGVETVNTLNIYNNYRKTNTELLYHYDDSHWNSNATRLISRELYQLLTADPKLK